MLSDSVPPDVNTISSCPPEEGRDLLARGPSLAARAAEAVHADGLPESLAPVRQHRSTTSDAPGGGIVIEIDLPVH
jgi:hypothetical protein